MHKHKMENQTNPTNEQLRREKLLKDYQDSSVYKEKLVTRLKITDACNRSNEAKVYAMAACKADPIFFIENFCWTPNDKYKQYDFPFLLYDFQKNYVEWLNEHIDQGRDGLVEKSREMGVTWLTTTLFLWKWLFNDNFNALLGSYKQELVDDKTKDSLFGMLDYNLRSLPKWMLPKKFKFNIHRTSMKIVNPENNNVLKGDTMNAEFGRGSRRSVIFMDEGAHWEYFQDAWDSASQTTNCRMTISTPLGYNAFAAIRNSDIDVKTMHWRLHPLKDELWYEYEKSRNTDDAVAQELDISYNKSQKGRVYPEWDNVVLGDFPFNQSLPLYVSWDFGNSDDTGIIWWQRQTDGKYRIVDCYWNHGKTIDFYVPFVTGFMPSDAYKYSDRDIEIINSHKDWGRGTHFGDPAGRFRNQVVNKSVIDVLRENGIHVNFRDEWKEFDKRITASKLLMRDKLVLNENVRTKYLNICMLNSKYPEQKSGGLNIIVSTNLKPKHDAYSHLRSSFEYGALGLANYQKTSGKIYDKFSFNETNSKSTVRY